MLAHLSLILFTLLSPLPQKAVSASQNTSVNPPYTSASNIETMSLSIPSIRLTAQIDIVGLGPDRLQIVPTSAQKASWFKKGAIPGNPGSAVLAGHYYWDNKPGVFYRLRELQAGDTFSLTLNSKEVRQFRVQKVKVYPKEKFPTVDVYTAKDSKRLNLITCHGLYDPKSSDYSHRLVVYSTLI
jgi:LPXTG-site transpeptidase (sortase) family protein